MAWNKGSCRRTYNCLEPGGSSYDARVNEGCPHGRAYPQHREGASGAAQKTCVRKCSIIGRTTTTLLRAPGAVLVRALSGGFHCKSGTLMVKSTTGCGATLVFWNRNTCRVYVIGPRGPSEKVFTIGKDIQKEEYSRLKDENGNLFMLEFIEPDKAFVQVVRRETWLKAIERLRRGGLWDFDPSWPPL